MKLYLMAFAALLAAAPDAAADDCTETAETALRYATNTSCDLASAQCRKHYRDKFLRECREAAYGGKGAKTSSPPKKTDSRKEKIQAYNNEAAGHFRAGRPEKAIEAFTRALELDPGNAELLYNRGTAYARLGSSDKAIADLSAAIDEDPEVAGGNAFVIRGNELFRKGDYDGVIKDFTSALVYTPEDAAAYASRALAYAAKGQYDRAITDYSAAIKLDAANTKFLLARAQAYAKAGKADAARADEAAARRLMNR